MTNSSPALAHKDQTVQDLIDGMSSDEKELQALIVGAALKDEDLSGDTATVKAYLALSPLKQALISFMVGNILAEQLKHSDLEVDNFLAHFGVKGMKWGVRKADISGVPRLSKSRTNNPYDRREAREKVRSGTGTLADAHLAALKSTGHRAINAFTGDKRFWRNMAVTAGVAVTAAAAISAAPAVMPTGILVALGTGSVNATGAAFGLGNLAAAMGTAELASMGAGVITSIGMSATGTAAGVAAGANVLTNTGRAIRGNSRINRSHAELGKNILNRQTEGSKATQRVLNRSGSLSKGKVTPPKPAKPTIEKPKLKQSDLKVGAFLAHHADVKLVFEES